MLIYCNFRASSLPKELKRVVDRTHISSAWPKPRTGLLTRSWSNSSKCNNSKALQYRISTDAPVSTSTRRSSVVPRSFWVTSEETTRGSGATLWLAPSPHQWTRWLPLGPCVWLLIGLLHLWRSTYFRWGHHLLTTSRFPHYYHPPSSDACFCSGRQLQLGTVSGLSFLPVCLSCLLGPNIRPWCSMYPDGTHSIFHCCDQEPTQFWWASDPGVSTLRVALGMKASISDSKREGFDVTCDQAAGPTRPGWKVLVVVLLICNTLLCLFVRGWLH